LWDTAKTGSAHQARDSVAATAFSGIAQIVPDPSAPHDPVLIGM
jgi:hypothetical protein